MTVPVFRVDSVPLGRFYLVRAGALVRPVAPLMVQAAIDAMPVGIYANPNDDRTDDHLRALVQR